MATATFFTTAKRHNSTLIPTGGTVLNVSLKNGCDLLAPTFYLDYASVPSWSMMEFAGRYYFITGVTSLRQDYWQIDAEVDVLATYKADIQATTAFVLYDATANSDIIDSRLAVNTQASVRSFATFLAPNQLTAAGKYVITVVGDESTQSFIVTDSDIKDIIKSTKIKSAFEGQDAMEQPDIDFSMAEQLPTGTDLETYIKIGEFVKSGVRTARQAAEISFSGDNPLDCIRSAIWYPWDVSGDGASQEIKLGTLLGTGVYARPIINKIIGNVIPVTIPWQANDWRRNSPYHHIYLYIPFVGMIQLSNADIIDVNTIHVGWSLNRLTGEFAVQVMRDYGEEGAGNIIGVYSADTAAAVPIGSSNISPRQAINALVTGIGAAASVVSGNVFGAAALAAQSIGAISPSISCIGGASGGASYGLDMNIICFTVFHDTSAEPNTIAPVIGTPTMAHHSLAQKTGYVQTQDASVGGSMTDTERQRINQLLDGGIYIE